MANDQHETDFNALIPELARWNDGKGIDIDSWLACVGNFELAVGYARLFWPEFTVHDDCVLFAGFNESSFRGFMEHTHGNKKAVEAVMNHRHILDLFRDPALEPSRELVIHLGRALKDMWSCKLQRDFPSRNVTVSFPETDNEYLLDYEITFFQDHDPVASGGKAGTGFGLVPLRVEPSSRIDRRP